MNLILNDELMRIINNSRYDTLGLKEGQKPYHVRGSVAMTEKTVRRLAESDTRYRLSPTSRMMYGSSSPTYQDGGIALVGP